MPARDAHFIDVGNNNVVKLQLVSSSYSTGLLSALGISEKSTTGEVPQGKTQIGQGVQAALENGCFGLNVVYNVTATKNQVAKVLCSPTKASTVFSRTNGARTQTYRGKNIVEAKVPKRRTLKF